MTGSKEPEGRRPKELTAPYPSETGNSPLPLPMAASKHTLTLHARFHFTQKYEITNHPRDMPPPPRLALPTSKAASVGPGAGTYAGDILFWPQNLGTVLLHKGSAEIPGPGCSTATVGKALPTKGY
jgi:hypothetical protein